MYWNVVYGSIEQLDDRININMRCIEITIYEPYDLECSLININMRCIEIGLDYDKDIQETGLTLTWDVLKFLF